MPVTFTVGGVEQKSWDNWTLAFSKIRAVCRPCNNEWMGSWETPAKILLARMIRGESVRLSEVDQLTLATWATIKAYVYDSATKFPSAVTREECELSNHNSDHPAMFASFWPPTRQMSSCHS
jgi:hypothetical protein